MQLKELLTDLRTFSGIRQKREIQTVAHELATSYSADEYQNGDDTAVIKSNNGFDLFASEGFLNAFVDRDPWFAGWCGIMVNNSDIAAMGGRATAIVNTVWGQNNEQMQQLLRGMVAASHAFRIPIVGGHTNLQTQHTHLCVSILGRANRLLSSFSAQPGHALVAAIDLRGAFRQPFLNWNAATEAPHKRLRADLALLPTIAEHGLAIAAKDISQAGILGTCVMLLESSNVGARIQLENIPKPAQVSWHDWLRSFPSFGYLLTTPVDKLDSLLKTFHDRNIDAAHIGNINAGPSLYVSHEGQAEEFWDLDTETLTGMEKKPQKIPTTNTGRAGYA